MSLRFCLVLGLYPLVVYDHVAVCSMVPCGVLCQLCVQLGAVLQLRVRSLDGCDLHMVCRCLRFWGVVSEDLRKL